MYSPERCAPRCPPEGIQGAGPESESESESGAVVSELPFRFKPGAQLSLVSQNDGKKCEQAVFQRPKERA